MHLSLLFAGILISTLSGKILDSNPDATLENYYHASCNKCDALQDWKRYEFKTAIVKLVSKVVQAGVEVLTETTLYIKDYGASEARYIKETRNITILNKTEVSESHTIMDKEWLVTIKDGKTTKIKNPAAGLMNAMNEQNSQQFAKGMMDALNAKTEVIGTKTIADKVCQLTETVTDMAGMKMTVQECKYKGLNLSSVSKGMGSDITEEVVSFEENVEIPEEPFKY